MQNNLPAAHPAFEGFVVPESPIHSCLARAEGDLEGPDAAGGRIAAFVFAGAACQSGPGSNAGLGGAGGGAVEGRMLCTGTHSWRPPGTST